MPIDPEPTRGSESASIRVRRTDVWLAWVLLALALLAGLASSRTFVDVPISMMSGKWNVLETVAIVSGFIALFRLGKRYAPSSDLRPLYIPLFLIASDVIIATLSLASSYLHLDFRSHLLATVLSLYLSIQRPLTALCSLITGVYAANMLGRQRVFLAVSTSAVLTLVVGVLQALYKGGIWMSALAPLRRFDLATGGIQATFHRPMGLSVGANAFGAFGAMCVAFAFGAGTGAGRSTRATLLFSGMSIVMLSQSRGSMLAVGCIVLAYVAHGLVTAEGRSDLKRTAVPAIAIMVSAIVLAVTLPGSTSRNLTNRVTSAVSRASSQQSYDSGIDGRIEGWKNAVGVVVRAPLGTQLSSGVILRGPLDNEFLERAIRGGLTSLIPMLVFLVWLAFVYRPQGSRRLGLLMAVGIAALGMSMSVSAAAAFVSFSMLIIGTNMDLPAPTDPLKPDDIGEERAFRPARPQTAALVLSLAVVAALTLVSLSHRPNIVTASLAYDARMLRTFQDLDRYRSLLDSRVRAHCNIPVDPETSDSAITRLLGETPPVSRKTQLLRLSTVRDECTKAVESAESEHWGDAQAHLDGAEAASFAFAEMR